MCAPIYQLNPPSQYSNTLFQFEARSHRLTRRTSLVDLTPVQLSSLSPRIRMHAALANFADTRLKVVSLSNGAEIRYGWLLIASGAVPRHLPLPPNPHVITIRDQTSVMNLAAALKHDCSERLRVVLVGGGGIAMELAQHPVLQNCDVVWVRQLADAACASLLLTRCLLRLLKMISSVSIIWMTWLQGKLRRPACTWKSFCCCVGRQFDALSGFAAYFCTAPTVAAAAAARSPAVLLTGWVHHRCVCPRGQRSRLGARAAATCLHHRG